MTSSNLPEPPNSHYTPFAPSDITLHHTIAWMTSHSWVPFLFVVFYAWLNVCGPVLVKIAHELSPPPTPLTQPTASTQSTQPSIRTIWSWWNLTLSIFSMCGASVTVPHLVHTLTTQGFHTTLCRPSEEWYMTGNCGWWMLLFVLSKIPELGDTVFLVLQQKPVIMLHWYHHITVLLYCWHAIVVNTPLGLWFAAINYCVHSVMYMYYYLSISGGRLRAIARPFAQCITLFQLLQMVAGSTLTAMASYHHMMDPSQCAGNDTNYRMAWVMYVSYLLLFARLFYALYVAPDGKHTAGVKRG